MVYLPNYEWDIFISYAHRDNDSPGPSRKWITRFYERLVPAIEGNLDGELKTFFDQREQRSYNTIESIIGEVQRSAIFLIIGSPNWVRSNWCQKELDAFNSRRADPTRVFVAEFMPPRGELRYSSSVPNNLRLRFWKESEEYNLPISLKHEDDLFEERLAKLVFDVSERIIALKNSRSSGDARVTVGTQGRSGPGPAGGHTIFLAYGTPDVEEEREAVRNRLVSLGVDVLPVGDLPADPESLRAIVEDGLSRSTIFVQLLGLRKSRAYAGSEISPTMVQAELAGDRCRLLEEEGDRRRQLKIFRWRPDDIDPLKNPDEVYRPLLASAQNGSPTELGQDIMDTLEQQQGIIEGPVPTSDLLKLIINSDPVDRARAEELFKACEGKNIEVMLDEFDNNELARADWADASAVAYLQGEVAPSWLMARWAVFGRARRTSGASSDLKGQALVFAPPPEDKAKGRILAQRLKELDLSTDWDVTKFAAWVDGLTGDAPRNG